MGVLASSYMEVIVFCLMTFSMMFIFLLLRKGRQEKDEAVLESSIKHNLHIPPTLHPEIDPNICIGSLSCINACPEGDILGIIDGKAKLTIASNCIGHGKCELECPVDAINLVFGTSERGVDLPEVDEFYESSKAGIHIVGELGGMGLIKNASRQGIQVGEFLASKLSKQKRGEKVPVFIVGAGPAGMATALSLKAKGVAFEIVTQTSMGGTIANYPRHKVVMTEKVKLPIYGNFGKRTISKEDLISEYTKAMKKGRISIKEGICVEKISGSDGHFTIQTSKGIFKAQKVVLAIGRMGTPRKLDVPGEDREKVTYLLSDPIQYKGKHVLVVGGGDSAMESVKMIANETNAKITFSYRNSSIRSGKIKNREAIEKLISEKRITPMMPSVVKKIDRDSVTLSFKDKLIKIKNDYVIVNAGGVLPTGFLKDSGISVKKHFGEVRASKSLSMTTTKKKDKFLWGLSLAGLSILAYLAYVGREYYWLSTAERVRSPLHEMLKPGGSWGKNIGAIATIVMLSNFFYFFRKNLKFLKGKKSIKNWLRFHIFVGLMSPLVILFHAAFQSRNLIATICYISLLLVVVTGIIGRYLFGMISVNKKDLLKIITKLQHEINPILANLKATKTVHKILLSASEPLSSDTNLFYFLLHGVKSRLALEGQLISTKDVFPNRRQYRIFRQKILKMRQQNRRVHIFQKIKFIMSYWRVIHVVLAIALLIVISIHIYTVFQMGYGIGF